jgi:uncharacterized protein YciI
MKAVVIGESSGATMDQVMLVYPRHKAFVDRLIARGDVIGIGPFADRGDMAIFRSREAAEEFCEARPLRPGGIGEVLCGSGLERHDVALRRPGGLARSCESLRCRT